MESPKYLIIITLLDGQNFTVPDGAPDRIDATVFAEARFGNESILKSDPIKLNNSNPEFVTELAWQLDKRSLHQLRVERRAIKLQVFMQTRERRKANRQNQESLPTSNGFQSNDTSATHKIELIGYTVIDIRSAQETEQPKFHWLPLLNPKFRKSSYNRPEVQLAVTLSRIDENTDKNGASNQVPSTSSLQRLESNKDENSDWQSENFNESETDSLNDSKLYKTCLDFTTNSDQIERDEIIENDIKIITKNGNFYIYDSSNTDKSTIDDCDEKYKITVTIPFNSELVTLIGEEPDENYYFSATLFGASMRSRYFTELTSVETKEIEFIVFTTHSGTLTTYFELNSSLVIKLHRSSGEPLGLATIQIDQLCSLDSKCRSIEGIFALQSMSDHDIPLAIHPTIGVSVCIERVDHQETTPKKQQILVSETHIEMAKEHFGEDIDDYLSKTLNDTHQLTLDDSSLEIDAVPAPNVVVSNSEVGDMKQDDHHFCFTIDLKNFYYTQDQRLIPTLRELVVRYSYPFFGYKDTITTDASIPISPTNSIIVSGFCEFNFATTPDSLLLALKEIPLNLEILACEQIKRVELDANYKERIIATSKLNLAQIMELSEVTIKRLNDEAISTTVSTPIYGLDGSEIGEIQIYLCLKDLGQPSYKFKSSIENLGEGISNKEADKDFGGDGSSDINRLTASLPVDNSKLDAFITEAKSNLESWKNGYCEELVEEIRKRENERYRRLCQRLEAKDAKREQEFRKKIDELTNLEKRFKNSLIHIESLERKLCNNFEQMKSKDALLDTRLDTIDLKISQAINNVKLEYDRRIDALPISIQAKSHDNTTNHCVDSRTITRASSKPTTEASQMRRSSLKTSSSAAAGIPVPVRSSSLVRGPADNGFTTRLVKRPTGVTTTVVNGVSTKARSNSTRLNLSKETQEKLASLRREKAELLKRGCRPNDELIQEINSLIEKLVC